MLIISVLTLFQFAPGSGYGKTIGNADDDLHLPEHFGEVVYQEHVDRDDRVYIIAQSHRSTISGKENEDCQQVQAEIYRIGEWLITNEHVEAILPEGYLSNGTPGTDLNPARPRGKIRPSAKLDDTTLVSLLANPTAALSADRLLYDTYGLALRQVEDRKLFGTVTDLLRSLLSNSPQNQPSPNTRPLLDYQQQKRSAVILENIRGALAEEGTEAGTPVRIRRAILTIGLSHVGTMIDLLNNGKTQIPPPPGMEDWGKGYTCDLTGLKESCAIFVIIPQALKKSHERLHQSHSPAAVRPGNGLCPSGEM